ncbi:MAG: ATP-binding protein, partial [Bacteroidota bacterium]|nr:ATP-binding protein [Bacteroidota bacterium]
MSTKNFLVLSQYRESSEYNDFIGRYYHFPGHDKKNYLSFFNSLPIEFVYYEPEKDGKGEFFGYGRIVKSPFEDKREKGNYFVEIAEYKPFSKPVYFKNEENKILEQEYSPQFYNAQNAVRRTTEEFIENICLDGGILLNFKTDAHLLKVLGEELIATEKVGVLELVKNSYDAHATYCKVRVENVPGLNNGIETNLLYPNLEGPVIIVEDDGDGMDRYTIENGWLRPASTIKTTVKEILRKEKVEAIQRGKIGAYESLVKKLKKEHGNRLPLGEKGVGRFATRRLGSKLEIRTKTAASTFEYVLKINWDEFDDSSEVPKDLDSVAISLQRENPSRDYGPRNSGTRIIIFGGREGFSLTESIISEINRTFLQLKSPFRSPEGFDVTFECPQIRNLDTALITDEFEPTFSFYGIVDENGLCDFELNFSPPRNIPMVPE